MEQVQKQGFGLVFDGEWGDELFYATLKDLARVGEWQQVLQQLKTEKRWHSTLWYELLLPHLPKYWQTIWFAKWKRNSNRLPPWITPTYAQNPQTQVALQQYFESFLSTNLMQGITWAMESAGSVGITQVYRLLGYFYRLESTSPLQDQRLIEFAINLPPSLQNDPVHEKIFLRKANQLTLPEDIRWRPKHNYFDPVKYAGLVKGHQTVALLEQLPKCLCLQDFVDSRQVENSLKSYCQGYIESYIPGKPFRNDIASKLYNLFVFINWEKRIKKYLNE
jgi:asparagine synthase (glutamine-hydrolysing)